jgi:hypothetical protein
VVARIGFATVLAIGVVWTEARAAKAPHAEEDESDPDEAEQDSTEAAEQNTKEVAHEVSVSLAREPGVALFTVTRTFAARASSAPISIYGPFDIPEKAVVTSFAIRTDGRWRRGTLRRDNPTRPRWGRPKLPGRGQPWVVVDWENGGRLWIGTPAFRAAGRVQVRYTVWAKGEPTEKGHRWAYCEYDREDAASPLEVLPSSSKTAIDVRPDAKESACREIESREPERTKLITRFGVFDLGHDIWVWRAELVAPKSLGTAPVPSAPFPLVFVLDASHSQERQGGLATQLAIVQAYLANVPKAEVELVVVGRDAQRLFARLVPAPEVAASLPAGLAQRPLGNGSFLDRGAAVAADLLARDGRPGRVVLFTDDQLRAAFDVKDVAATLGRAPRGTIVDIIHPVSRDWEGVSQIGSDRPAQIASALGGGYYRVTVRTPTVPAGPQLAAKLRSLLVPDSIQEIVMESAGHGRDDWPGLSTVETVSAGQEVILHGSSSMPPPRTAALTGWLGGKKLTFPFRPDPVMQRQVPRLVDPEADYRPCEEGAPRLEAAGLRQGFLTRGLLFWVPGAGAAPPSVGFNLGDPCLNSSPGLDLGSAREVKRDELPATLTAAARRCGVGGRRARIETQADEILEVSVEGGDDESRRCAAESIWSFSLPAKFNENHPKRETYEVVLQAPAP